MLVVWDIKSCNYVLEEDYFVDIYKLYVFGGGYVISVSLFLVFVNVLWILLIFVNEDVLFGLLMYWIGI